MKTANPDTNNYMARAERAARQGRRALNEFRHVLALAPDFTGLAQRERSKASRCRKEAIFFSQQALEGASRTGGVSTDEQMERRAA